MNIQVNPEEIMSPEAYSNLKSEAQQAKMPIEVYLIRQYDESFSGEPKAAEPVIIREEKAAHEDEVEEATEFEKLFGGSTAYGMLVKGGYDSMEKLTRATEQDLLDIPYFGKKKLETVLEILDEAGYALYAEEEEWVEEFDPAMQLTRIDRSDMSAVEFLKKAVPVYMQAWDTNKSSARKEIRRAIDDLDIDQKSDATDELYEAILYGLPMDNDTLTLLRETADENGVDNLNDFCISCVGADIEELNMSEAHDVLTALEQQGESDIFDEFDFDEF